MYANGIKNEENYVTFINEHVALGVTNFVFKGSCGRMVVYRDVTKCMMSLNHGTRINGKLNKSDVTIIDRNNNEYYISLKMSNVQTSWESADSQLKHVLEKFIDCYGKVSIPGGNRLRIEDHGIDLTPFVFGDDINKENGSIIVQTISAADVTRYNADTVIVECRRIFRNIEDVMEDGLYKPCIAVRRDSSRNKTNPKLKGYRIEVIPQISSVSIEDIIDFI